MSISQGARERPNLPETHYIDNRIYTSSRLFEEEQPKIFERVWNFVCLECEVATPGAFRTVRVASHPLIVVRGQDGRLRAFYNICRHRGMQVMRQEAGQAKFFQCIYHLWTYGLDGCLSGVTLPEGYEGTGFCQKDFGLVAVRLETIGGLVFVCLNANTEPLRDYLGAEMVGHIEDTVGRVELEVFHFHKQLIKANWKQFVDNNNEPYHNFLHVFNRNSSLSSSGENACYPNGHYFSGSQYRVVNYGTFGLEGREKHLFPGTAANGLWTLIMFPDVLLITRGTVARIDRMVPLSPGRTLIEWRGVGIKGDTPDVRAMRVRHHNQIWGPMGRNLPEDIAAVEEQWEKLQAGVVRYSIFARQQPPAGFDDTGRRHWYQTWSRVMGRSAHDPFGGEGPALAVASAAAAALAGRP
jgi:phenylpropionate dioxygenase-like ring-hydroxylating dioxygenase large terminal subunit